jgi:hypothetical protein
MMNFLPQVYEDELLYSVLARYRRMCGMVSKAALFRDLFHEKRILTSIYFPQYLKELVDNFPPQSKLTVNEIIEKHTMFPFYTAFLNGELARDIFLMMGDSAHIGIENVLGFAGSKVKPRNVLLYCPLCYREDMDSLGESYWRRLYQVPGVFYCPKHKVRLKESIVPSTDDTWEHRCADLDVCSDSISIDLYAENIKELNLQYIRNVIQLMSGNFPKRDLDDLARFYVDALRTQGYTSVNGNVYLSKLVDEFTNFYQSDYLQMMQSTVDKNQAVNWLRRFLAKNGKNRSPLRHLLILQFLNISLNELFASNEVKGKLLVENIRLPKFDLEERKKLWLKIVETHQGANRAELQKIGKGLYTWIRYHDREWYEQVTPRSRVRKKRELVIDWKTRDDECLVLARQAVDSLMAFEGKPIRITLASIRREIGVRRWLDNPKLVKTHQFIKEITEDINAFRLRKIKWSLKELRETGKPVTAYKLQLHAGFGGNRSDVIDIIEAVLGDEMGTFGD